MNSYSLDARADVLSVGCMCSDLYLECGIRAVWFCSCPPMTLMCRRVSLAEHCDVWNCAAHTPSMEGGKRGALERSGGVCWGGRRGHAVGLGGTFEVVVPGNGPGV